MKTEPLVSVIVPAYNAGAFLDATLASAQAQTYPHLEVLVVDDGSTDSTHQIAETWAKKDDRFIALKHPANAGLPSTRNTAIRASHGELIAFLDADDVWLPGKIESQVKLLGQYPNSNILFTNYWLWDGQKDLALRYPDRRKFPDGDVTKLLYRWNQFGISSVMVKRATLDVTGLFDPEMRAVEDWDLWSRVAETGLESHGVWEPQLRYRIWAGNMTGNKVKICEYVVLMLEKALRRPQNADRSREYGRALQIARGHLELARARIQMEQSPDGLRDSVLRAWRHCPWRVKWLLWYLGTASPAWLGGRFTTNLVQRKIREKW